MSKIQKFVCLIPFLAMCGCLIESWAYFISGDDAAPKHYATLVLVVLNAILYFVRFRAAIRLTGVILCFGIANLVSFYHGTSTFTIMGSPDIETRSFLILVLYGVIDFGFFGDKLFRRRDGAASETDFTK